MSGLSNLDIPVGMAKAMQGSYDLSQQYAHRLVVASYRLKCHIVGKSAVKFSSQSAFRIFDGWECSLCIFIGDILNEPKALDHIPSLLMPSAGLIS
jgi:hypothetical protein